MGNRNKQTNIIKNTEKTSEQVKTPQGIHRQQNKSWY